jgi:uncharacterized repeat protein (TIGR03803 family)
MRQMIGAAGLCGAITFGAHAGNAATLLTLHQFSGADGSLPQGGLVMDASGMLYGTTYLGGTGGGGTIFSFNPVTSVLTTLHAFPTTGTSGNSPVGALLLGGGGRLYGVTEGGGGTPRQNGCGTIFQLDIATRKLTTLHAFSSQADGAAPQTRLEFDTTRKILYGTTALGGDTIDCPTLGCGTVFKLVIASKAFTTLHQFIFTGDGGGYPETGVTVDPTGLLYGTASARGENGSGTVFQLDPNTNAYATPHEFDYHVDGDDPMGDLALKQGLLYGTTRSGGPTSAGDGTIYVFNVATQAFTTLHSLDGANDGLAPEGPLLAGKQNLIYGTASQGGGEDVGTVFSLNTKTLVFNVLHTFTGGSDGALPETGVIQDQAGILYGVTSFGDGTIFKISP